jgi:tetratricopeptide (TPR) repeat protein
MKKILLVVSIIQVYSSAIAQTNTRVKEYKKVFTTYPYSDPSPVPDPSSKIYPYFRYDGFTTTPQQKEWKVVELENDYIKVTILPEIGGKVWTATEKKTGKDFLYNNHVVKFRDVAMRGPWTSGGIEPNYGIIGHTPNCAAPVDYTTMKKEDGSVSCIIGVLDLLTQTQWRLEVNLPADKAFFTTQSFWYNSSSLEQPYYTWMNTGIKAKGNLEFIYPGTHHLGHEGEYGDWPVNKKNGKNISFYEQNNFGGYKSYHVFGTYTNFFGGYWHDDDYGMAHYSTHDDKAGKKIWIWGLSQQGMIWEKLLTDNDGQYVEVQSGRLFNQSAEKSVGSPFKYRGFTPNETDRWTEYWFPVVQTKGFVKANEYGALNVRREIGWLKINFCPVQKINDELQIHTATGNRNKQLSLLPLQTFADSVRIDDNHTGWNVSIGSKIAYSSKGYSEAVLSRPIQSPSDFDWNSVYGLYLAGESFMEQRKYAEAAEKINTCLQKDKNYVPALTALSELEYRKLNYKAAFEAASKALSINTYDAAANYYYGLAALKLNKLFDAKDGFDIATQSAEFRVAAFNRLSTIYFKENEYAKAETLAKKSLLYNQYNIDALQLLAVLYRKINNVVAYNEALQTIDKVDPLNHFAAFEKYFSQPAEVNKVSFLSAIQNEMPSETCMELAAWYYRMGCIDEIKSLLVTTPVGPEASVWKKHFAVAENKTGKETGYAAFPFREETAEILEQLLQQSKDWRLKYYLGLIYQSRRNMEKAKALFTDCGNEPIESSFYAARAALIPGSAEADLLKAIAMDKEQWRFYKLLGDYYLNQGQYDKALPLVESFYKQHPVNYIIGMLYAKTLLLNKKYKECDALLSKLNIIPFEGATDGRQLYREAKLMQAVEAMQKMDCKKALQLISEAKLWPESLGEGKPYDADIDERLENWMAHLCYEKIKKPKNADASLQRISDFNSQTDNTLSTTFAANHLITAWALEKKGQAAKAKAFLDERVRLNPSDKILEWAKDVFDKKPAGSTAITDATVRILKELMKALH